MLNNRGAICTISTKLKTLGTQGTPSLDLPSDALLFGHVSQQLKKLPLLEIPHHLRPESQIIYYSGIR